jgi:hypothetical protein
MTEAEWDTSADPAALLEFLRDKAGERKLRLFACACCRRIWDLLSPDPGRPAVETAERWADGQATEQEVWDARRRSFGFADQGTFPRYADAFGVTVLMDRAWDAAAQAAKWAVRYREEACEQAKVAQGRLLHCVFGNPYRSVAICPSWLEWNGGCAFELARDIYDTRAFDRLPRLADAVEEAGCADAAILQHCREPGEHVRGCWVVDLLLGKSWVV